MTKKVYTCTLCTGQFKSEIDMSEHFDHVHMKRIYMQDIYNKVEQLEKGLDLGIGSNGEPITVSDLKNILNYQKSQIHDLQKQVAELNNQEGKTKMYLDALKWVLREDK